MSNNQDIVLNYIFTYDNSTNFVHNILNIDISNTITNFYINSNRSSRRGPLKTENEKFAKA